MLSFLPRVGQCLISGFDLFCSKMKVLAEVISLWACF